MSWIPVYLKQIYYDDPLFSELKIVYSVYNNDFKKPFRNTFGDKIISDGINKDSLNGNYDYESVSKMAIDFSDGIIIGSKEINKELEDYIKSSKKPVLGYQDEEVYIDAYNEFYDKILK